MLTIVTLLTAFLGYEGHDNENIYVGMYTPKCEYGYIIKKDLSDFWLDTVYVKDYNVKHKENTNE